MCTAWQVSVAMENGEDAAAERFEDRLLGTINEAGLGLMLSVGFMHFKIGVQVLIEDYTHGMARKVLIIATVCLSYAAAATGLFAIARIAL